MEEARERPASPAESVREENNSVAPMEMSSDASGVKQERKDEAQEKRLQVALPQAAAPANVPLGAPTPLARKHIAVVEWMARESNACAASIPSEELHAPYTREELQIIFDDVKATAPGSDHIPAQFLKMGGAELRQHLLALFNFSWVHGVLPLDWRSAHVKALYKGQGEQSSPNNYRPISLTSCTVRILEKLIHKRLYAYVESHQLLAPMQFGFRHQHSTLDAVFVLTEWVKEVTCEVTSAAVPVAFLDLAKAYDRTWHAGLLFQLAQAGIKGRAWSWVRAFLSGRRFRIVGDGACSQWQGIDASVPQGAVLGPLLFALYANPIAKLFDSEEFQRPMCSVTLHGYGPALPPCLVRVPVPPDPPWPPDQECGAAASACALLPVCVEPRRFPCIRVQLFADDIAIAPDTRLLGWEECFQRALIVVQEFASEWRLTFSLDGAKSAIVYFNGEHHRPSLYPRRAFTLNGVVLQVVEQYKYLGVWLQGDMTWTVHYEELLGKARFFSRVIQRCIPRIAAIRASTGGQGVGGPHFSAIRALVLGCLYSRCTYGIQFIQLVGLQAKLERIQSYLIRPLRRVLGLSDSAHGLFILAESDCPTLDLFRQQLLLSYARRVEELPSSHSAWQQLHRSRRLLADGMLREVYLPRRPMLLEVLDAERTFGKSVLRPISFAPLQPPILHSHLPTILPFRTGEYLSRIFDRAVAESLAPPTTLSASDASAESQQSDGDPANRRTQQKQKREDLRNLARQLSFQRWQQQPSGAILRGVKTRQGRSHYLYLERRSISVLRSRLRANRCNLGESLHRRALAATDRCSHAGCRRAVETVEHALMHCVKPELLAARATVRQQLRAVGVQPLTLALMLGEPPPAPSIRVSHRPGANSLIGSVDASRADSVIAAGACVSCIAGCIPLPIPPPACSSVRSVWLGGGGPAPRPSPQSIQPSARKSARHSPHIRTLRITAVYLRALQRIQPEGVL